MCLVSYVPFEEGYLLTSNRDEDKIRAKGCLLPQSHALEHYSITFPKDPKGGTWIAQRDDRDCLVLLNGAFEKHIRESSYNKSRGLIFLELFEALDTMEAWKKYNLEGVEPFTLCFIYRNEQMFELVWDGGTKHTTELDMSKPHLWMSCTLYSRYEYTKIKEQFIELSQRNIVYSDIMDFHAKHTYQKIKNNLGIETIDTVSLTQITCEECSLSLQYVTLL